MKVIVAGPRDFTDYNVVVEAILKSGYVIDELVSGKASGVDTLGEEYARENGIPVREFPAQWNLYGKHAGPARNHEMSLYADALIAVWDGISGGTHDMIKKMKKRKKPFYLHIVLSGDKQAHGKRIQRRIQQIYKDEKDII
jgi:hypothetical protein